MKKLIFNLAVIGFTFIMVLGACQKDVKIQNKVIEEDHQISKSSPINDIEFNGIEFRYSYNDIDNILTGQDFRNKLIWKQVDADGHETEIGAIKYNFNDLGTLKFVELKENSVIFQTKLGMTSVKINVQDNSKLSFSIPVSSDRTVNFSLVDPNLSIQNLFDNYDKGDIIIIDDVDVPAIWPLVFAAAALIASAVDYYCDNQISNGAADCTGSSMCTVVNSCSVTCVVC